jgi:HAE1 family hydrophobic/amphiphilic exporter-1
MNLVASCVRNPVKVAVGVLLLGLFGLIALDRMPMQLTPEVQRPTLSIETLWPGGSPQEVEREIVQEQEEQLKSVEGLVKLTSESSDSSGKIILEFTVGTDMSEALLKVNSRLQQVREYPEEAEEPVISTSNSSDNPIAWFIVAPLVPDTAAIEAFQAEHPDLKDALEPARRVDSHGLRLSRLRRAAEADDRVSVLLPQVDDVTKLRRFVENAVEARFERVPGVSNSNVLGGREDEMQVIVDPELLAARGITIDVLRAALRNRNQDTSGGDFWEGKRRYVVRTLGRFKSPQDVEGVLLSDVGGAPVYVRDVAQVRLGYKKASRVVRNFGETAIAVNCLRETGANVLEVMDGLKEAVAELNAGLMPQRGLVLKQVYAETDYINSAVGLAAQRTLHARDRSGHSHQHRRYVPDARPDGALPQRDQPGRSGVRGGHARGQRGRGARKHLPALPARKASPRGGRRGHPGGVRRRAGVHVDDAGRVRAGALRAGRSRTAVPRHRARHQLGRGAVVDRVGHGHLDRHVAHPEGPW